MSRPLPVQSRLGLRGLETHSCAYELVAAQETRLGRIRFWRTGFPSAPFERRRWTARRNTHTHTPISTEQAYGPEMTLAQSKLSDPPALADNNSNDVHARGNLPAALPSPRTPSPPAYVLSWTPNVPWRAIPLPPASAFFGASYPSSALPQARAPFPAFCVRLHPLTLFPIQPELSPVRRQEQSSRR